MAANNEFRYFFLSLGSVNYGGHNYAEMTEGDDDFPQGTVIGYPTREEAQEAAKKFPGSEVVEATPETDQNYHYRPVTMVADIVKV